MVRLSRPGSWYLFDYGMVLSAAPTPADWAALEAEAGLPLAQPDSPYWRHREGFDAGQLQPAQYWSAVLGQPVAEQKLQALEELDAAQWSHLNAETLDVLETLRSEGANLALLSNMPAGMSDRYRRETSWARLFHRTYFSGQLGLAKPDRRIFDHVLAGLQAAPERVLFIDDNAEIIATAQSLGFRTIHFQPAASSTGPATDLRQELPKAGG